MLQKRPHVGSCKIHLVYYKVQCTAIGPSSSLLHKCRCSHPEMLCRIAILKNPQNSGENTCNAKTSPATLLELEFHCRYFPIDFMKFFITAFFSTPLDDCFFKYFARTTGSMGQTKRVINWNFAFSPIRPPKKSNLWKYFIKQ